MSATNLSGLKVSLDPSIYAPDEEEKAFMKATTGILNDEELKTHIIAVQSKAYETYKYPCIRIFGFMKLRIARVPAYPQLLQLGKQREGAILLDLGCCFGSDIRKAILDGWPMEGVIAADLSKDFWSFGHELFRSTPETFPVPFLQGNVLDHAFLSPAPILPTSSTPPALASAAPLSEVTSLSQLHGQLSAIFTGALFHLFEFGDQEHVARALAGLLSPLPGSMIFGLQSGQPEKRMWCPDEGTKIYSHSAESWKELWEGVFAEVGVAVEVQAILRKRATDGGASKYGNYPESTEQRYSLEWSATRV